MQEVRGKRAFGQLGEDKACADALKQRRISAAALKYLNETGSDREVFFDVVSVTISGDESTVNYFPQAWIPMYL